MKTSRTLSAIAMAALLSACAAMVPMEPARLAPAAATGAAASLVLGAPAQIRLPTGYDALLPARSRWKLAGMLPQGAVYQRADGVFSVEGRHVHEAYLVVQGTTLRGFYLPVEGSFSPLPASVALTLGGS